MNVDFGRTAGDYGRYRAGFPAEFYTRLAGFGIAGPNLRVLDLGTGTGTLARGFARRECAVTGLDRAPEMIDAARALDREAGVTVDYRVGRAEDTGLPGEFFDLLTAGQCWHWLERDRAALEARRLLRPGGALVIANFDWLPLAGSVVEATEALIQKHNPGWPYGGRDGLHPENHDDLERGGFVELVSFSFDVAEPYSHEAWRGRIRASAGIAASLSPEQVRKFDAEHAAMLAARFPGEPLLTPHRVYATIGRTPRTGATQRGSESAKS